VAVGIVAAVIWILSRSTAFLRRLVRAYTYLAAWVMAFRLEIRPRGRDEVELHYRGRGIRGPPGVARIGRPGEWPVPIVEGARRDAEKSPLWSIVRRIRIPLPMDVAPLLASHAWEAVIVTVEPQTRSRLDLYRRIPRGLLHRASRHTAVTTYAGPSLVADLGTQWTKGRATGIVHAVGRPIRSIEGVRLDVNGDRSGALSPSQLEVDGVSLVLLQGDPNGASEVPTPATRLETAALRDFAVALVEKGAHSVLVVPALPEPTLRQVVEKLGTFSGRALRNRAERLAATRAIRDLLSGLPGRTHAEAALEVTLFEAERSA
jgi:hypothetical protein